MNRDLHDRTQPTADEVASVARSRMAPALLQFATEATAPNATEVARVLAGVRSTRAIPLWPIAGSLVVAGLALLLIGWPQPATDVAIAPVAVRQDIGAGPSIAFEGPGEVSVSERLADGAILALHEGRMTFEVDPLGSHRNLRVLAGDVEVRVTGTRFTVVRQDGHVSVDVERGSVEVWHSGVFQAHLRTGESWSTAPVPSPTPAPQAPIAAVERVPDVPQQQAEIPRTIEGAALAYAALLDRAADPDEALWDDLASFRAAWPDSPLAEEALLMEARGRRASDAVKLLELAFQSRRTTRSSQLHAERSLELQDCERALPSLRWLSENAPMAARSHANAWLGLCARSTGRRHEAEDALRAALRGQLPADLEQRVEDALEEPWAQP